MLRNSVESGCGGGVRGIARDDRRHAIGLRCAAMGGMLGVAGMCASTIAQQVIPTWDDAALWYPGPFPFGIDAADALGPPEDEEDLDGFPDIVVAVGQVSFRRGDLPGQYTELASLLVIYQNTQDWSPAEDGLDEFQVIELPEYTIAAEVIWADVTGDGRLDIVCSTTSHYDTEFDEGEFGIYVFDWDPSSENFGSAPYQYVPSSYPLRGLVADDFDNDGDVHVVAAVDWPEPEDANRDVLAIFDNEGGTPGSYTLDDESLTSQFGSAYESPTAQLVAGVFDKTPGGNMYPDLFTPLLDNHASLLTGSSTGFSDSTLTLEECGYAGLTGLAKARFTLGKFTDDVAAAAMDGQVHIYHGDGDADFGHNCDPEDEPNDVYFDGGCCGASNVFYPYDIASGHLNGDTKPDLVFTVPSAGVNAHAWMLLGKGDGKFQLVDNSSTYWVPLDDGSGDVDSPIRVVIADMDQDGFGDVVTSNHGSTALDHSVSVAINGLSILP